MDGETPWQVLETENWPAGSAKNPYSGSWTSNLATNYFRWHLAYSPHIAGTLSCAGRHWWELPSQGCVDRTRLQVVRSSLHGSSRHLGQICNRKKRVVHLLCPALYFSISGASSPFKLNLFQLMRKSRGMGSKGCCLATCFIKRKCRGATGLVKAVISGWKSLDLTASQSQLSSHTKFSGVRGCRAHHGQHDPSPLLSRLGSVSCKIFYWSDNDVYYLGSCKWLRCKTKRQ